MLQSPQHLQAVLGVCAEALSVQQRLADLNHRRLTPGIPCVFAPEQLDDEHESLLIEHRFIEADRARVVQRAAQAPRKADEFADWFDALVQDGPGQFDPLFDHLAERASLSEVKWFVHQEVAGEAGFEDLVALTQLRMPERAKLEMARNYWDEMGRGKPAAMHGPMLTSLATAIGLPDEHLGVITPESLALSNLLVGLAFNRRYAYHSVGALGAIELTAPSRAVKLVQAFDRLGIDRSASHYFRVHAIVDVAHARAWRDEILIPLVTERPELAVPLAEGALMRLQAGARTFERYRRHFSLEQRVASDGLAWVH